MEKTIDEAAEDTEKETETIEEPTEAVNEPEETGEEKESQEENGKEKKDKKESLIEELTDRVKRQMAEFENFRKRSDKEKSQMFDMGAKSVIEQLLPIVDNFERGLAAVPEDKKEDPFVTGMDKVYKQMTDMLEKIGVTPIEAVGCEFNQEFHNAVMHEDDENQPENTVSEEYQKGYLYKGQVVRHSMVKVVN